ncbi:MAG TPA: NAD(P)/FAD-dependent oxidoreductase [Polyangiales bacterium]|nr:NAD(P)/FAD-dependent oxidoreductase [Polyangiales bacterium]
MPTNPSSTAPTYVDVLIVGAGISGIGAAYYLQRDQPSKTYAIVESRAAIGGTWDLFRYPGIRSDSDLHTFGYEFKPWTDADAIADASAILRYLHETVDENGIAKQIRFQHAVKSVSWSSERARWTTQIERTDTGETLTYESAFIVAATGYYRYDQGYRPHFAGEEQFKGTIVHPQHWPADLDYAGKRVVVIGSGATAVTLIPAMADKTAHITMLQRTPTYIMPLPRQDAFANALKKVLSPKLAYALTRKKNIARQRWFFAFCQRFPNVARKLIRAANKKFLPEGFPLDVHFNPPYNPWAQRLCAVPDADLFTAITKGKASVVTDQIETFTERGIKLASGQELEADIIVTATGLNVQLFGGISVSIDGTPLRPSERLAFKGMMFDGVPNFAFAIGYTNSSWTLKVGLLFEHFCRLLSYMDEHGYAVCMPERSDPNMPTRPLLDFGAGYVKRALADLPRQGPTYPWVMSMDYALDEKALRHGPVEDPNLRFYRMQEAARAKASNEQPRLEAAAP